MHPASLDGEEFEVYCNNDKAKGGWTLIGKFGAGNWENLSDEEYFDLALSVNNDVQPNALLNEDNPVSGRTMAFYNKKKTDALGVSVLQQLMSSNRCAVAPLKKALLSNLMLPCKC